MSGVQSTFKGISPTAKMAVGRRGETMDSQRDWVRQSLLYIGQKQSDVVALRPKPPPEPVKPDLEPPRAAA